MISSTNNPISQAALKRKHWDVIMVGGGHNGLTCAAYLAKAGKTVLVLEAKNRLGGACTRDQPFKDPQFLISPCAYVVGLLHPQVIEELKLRDYGYNVHQMNPHLWVPFADGTSLTLWDDDALNAKEIAKISPQDVEGFMSYNNLFARIRTALRKPEADTWLGESPSRAALEELLEHDPELIEILFEESIASVINRYIKDERLKTALHGQGLIGTWAGPYSKGTAAIHAHHAMGTLEGNPGAWGFVKGGIGNVSFALADAAQAHGAIIISGVKVAEINPGVGVTLEDGTKLNSSVIVSNADPKNTLAMLKENSPTSFSEKVNKWKIEGPVFKINCALKKLPTFKHVEPGVTPHKAMVTIARSMDETERAYQESLRGVPLIKWAELYFQTAYDATVAPPSKHVMSVFAQYAPYKLSLDIPWNAQRRNTVARQALNEIARFAPDLFDCLEYIQPLAPTDIEANVGLSGGHIFQGECLPEQMWQNRFGPRTGAEGIYMCGAATHPGGSVIAANGRNAAMAVLKDLEK